MNQRKKMFGVFLFAGTNQVTFWIWYTQTGNIANSIDITAGISILVGFLYWLGKVDQRKRQW